SKPNRPIPTSHPEEQPRNQTARPNRRRLSSHLATTSQPPNQQNSETSFQIAGSGAARVLEPGYRSNQTTRQSLFAKWGANPLGTRVHNSESTSKPQRQAANKNRHPTAKAETTDRGGRAITSSRRSRSR